jgi:hypothetical protein
VNLKEEITELIELGESIKKDNLVESEKYKNQKYYNWISKCRLFLSVFAGKYNDFILINNDFIKISNEKNQSEESYKKLMKILYNTKEYVFINNR